MKWLPLTCLAGLLIVSCSDKEKVSPPAQNEFPSSSNPLPATLVGTWTRAISLRTFDYKPDEWVAETPNPLDQKYLQLNPDKTYSSNQLECTDCRVELLQDTLYVKYSKGFYKFPVLALNDTLLYLKTKIDQPEHSLPNMGLFDFILEEKYRKQ